MKNEFKGIKSFLLPVSKDSNLKKAMIITSILIVLIIVFLTSAILFLLLPTSILSESSDLNHDQRDETVIEETKENGQNFTLSNEGLVKAINLYKSSWLSLGINSSSSGSETNGQSSSGADISTSEFNLICSIIEGEAGENEVGAKAVASCVLNRIIEGTWDGEWEESKHLASNKSGKNDPLTVLTAKGQFAAYFDGPYKKYLDSPSPVVKEAVKEVFTTGNRTHDYTCFRSYETAESVDIEGNWFFSKLRTEPTEVKYTVEGESLENSQEINQDQNTTNSEASNQTENKDNEQVQDPSSFTAQDGWDLLYLITAYDVSKNNLEGEVKDEDGNNVSRYFDLIHRIGDFILKVAFGTEVEVRSEEIVEVEYQTYEPTTVTVYDSGTFKDIEVYKKSKTEKTKVELTVPVYKQAENIKIVTLPESLQGKNVEITETVDGLSLTDIDTGSSSQLYFEDSSDVFLKTDEVETIKPERKEVVKKEKVRGLSKGVLLSVLGIDPAKNYTPLNPVGISCADFIESSRTALIKVLSLNEGDYSLLSSNPGVPGTSATPSFSPNPDSGWIWPLDPNGRGSFIITSLMGTRESPGGIGSTNHKGTDIGASTGVAILAVQDGVVEIANVYGGYGNCVRLNHGTAKNGKTYSSLYGHMSVIACSVGQVVKQGQVIGYVGSTGNSTGPHLHFEAIENGVQINGLSMYGEDIYSKLQYYL